LNNDQKRHFFLYLREEFDDKILKMKNIAVFVSGSGSNAENLFRHFENSDTARVKVMFSNKPDIYALERAKNLGLEAIVFGREEFSSGKVLDRLKEKEIDYVVLAGFLQLMPETITRAYAGRILNIHPALLPKYGGKGMYGERVHRAVIEAGEKESGITIHRVNEKYDDGDIVFQVKVPVTVDDTPESLATKIHELEYKHFPRVVADEIEKMLSS
jgi:phosphoribosylglycinamide formyltransferase-1